MKVGASIANTDQCDLDNLLCFDYLIAPIHLPLSSLIRWHLLIQTLNNHTSAFHPRTTTFLARQRTTFFLDIVPSFAINLQG
jgi:hypothetical protein